MNINAEYRFANIPTEHMKRTNFDLSNGVKTSWNTGSLIPLKYFPVLPGDTFKIKTSKVIRMPSLITPILDNLFLDVDWFFVPYRLVWSHWKNLMGENSDSAWIPQNHYSVPQVTSPADTGWSVGTIADYLGIPTGVPGLSVSDLPFRAYALIVQEFWRDENLQDPVNIPVDDTTITGSNGTDYVTDLVKGGMPFTACKLHDAYTSALPGPQKGPAVQIPVATLDPLPVITGDIISSDDLTGKTLTWSGKKNNISIGDMYTGLNSDSAAKLQVSSADSSSNFAYPTNLWAMQSGIASAATINELRLAFQIQRLLERNARSGSRMIEAIFAHFGVRSSDARLQRPEFLGGNRIPLRIAQVLQQSESNTTPQGTPVGVSLTTDSHFDFEKSFTEHGIIMAVATVRYWHSYQQGIHPEWLRKDTYDFYWPALAHIGEIGIKNAQLYAQGSSVVNASGDPVDDEIFGYQEAWYDYKFMPNTITGMMRSTYAQSLDSWHLGDDYDSLPTLSSSWIKEDLSPVDRVLAVTSENTHQYFGDFWFDVKATRVMPYYSVPGLIDHF